MFKKIVYKITAAYTVLHLSLFALVAKAQSGNVDQGLSQVRSVFPSGGLINTTGGALALIVSIIKLMLLFAGAIAVLFVIIGGFWYITSAGNEEQAEKGRNTVVNAIIGIIIIVLSYTIINVIVRTVTQCTGGLFC